MTDPTRVPTCDGYEWRGKIPWKCQLPPGHKSSDGTFLGRACKGNDSTTTVTADAMTVIREALAAPHLQDDPASARLTPQEQLENRASVIYWALFDAGLLTEAYP